MQYLYVSRKFRLSRELEMLCLKSGITTSLIFVIADAFLYGILLCMGVSKHTVHDLEFFARIFV